MACITFSTSASLHMGCCMPRALLRRNGMLANLVLQISARCTFCSRVSPFPCAITAGHCCYSTTNPDSVPGKWQPTYTEGLNDGSIQGDAPSVAIRPGCVTDNGIDIIPVAQAFTHPKWDGTRAKSPSLINVSTAACGAHDG